MNRLLTIVLLLASTHIVINPITRAALANPCGAGEFSCHNGGQCILQSEVCDFVTSCADGSDEENCGWCEFEESLCGWTDVSSGPVSWQRHNGSMRPPYVGPSHDFTYMSSKTGNYMMLDSQNGSNSIDEPIMLSPVFGDLAATCTLQFAFYEVEGRQSITHVYLISPNTTVTTHRNGYDKWNLLWEGVDGYQVYTWTVAEIGIGRRQPGYRLVFKARTDSGAIGTAIDAVHFRNCSLDPPTGSCLSSQFTCKRGSCVDRNLLCDFSDDCGDNSDEDNSICSKYTNRCDFEQGMCNWIQDDANDIHWNVEVANFANGPWFDHTYGNSSGKILYTSIPTGSVRARLKSTVFQASTSGNCRLRFFYSLLSIRANRLNVYTVSSELGPLSLVWRSPRRQVGTWIRADIPLPDTKPFRVVIEAERTEVSLRNIAVDDVSFTPGCEEIMNGFLPAVLTTPSALCGVGKLPCNSGQCISSSLFCNFRADCNDNSDESRCPGLVTFETGSLQPWTIIGYTSSDYMFNWTVGSHGSPTTGTGPRIDHTTGTSDGNYAVLKADILATELTSFKSRLISPIYNQAGKTCHFTFWYTTHGSSFDTGNVYMRSRGTDHWLTSFGDRKNSDTQDAWQVAEAILPLCASSFQIIFEVDNNGHAAGFVAIDDLKFANCSYPSPPSSSHCGLGEYRCDSGHCISETLLCDFQTDCCDGSDEAVATCSGYRRCDFEYGMCGWSQSRTSQVDWYRYTDSLAPIGSRAHDHNLVSSSKHSIYMWTKPGETGERASLVYNLTQPNGTCVLRFWYLKQNSNSSKLNVYMHTSNKGMLLMKSLSTCTTQPLTWIRSSVTFNSSTAFQVVIEGVVGTEVSQGIISIDDVSFTPACGASESVQTTVKPTPPGNCSAQQFVCSTDKSCLDVRSVCDFRKDCDDGSDEMDCGTSCDFETHVTCGWRRVTPDGARWRIVTGSSQVDVRPGPRVDNTTGTGKGQYLLVDNHQGASAMDTVIFETNLYRKSSAWCTVLLAYSIDGDLRDTTLSFLVKTSQGQMESLWSADGINGSLPTWQTAQINVGTFQHFAFLIKVELSSGSVAAVSIDDIRLQNCFPGVSSVPLGLVCGGNTSFLCNSSMQCLPRSWVCDGLLDCQDGSDEPSDCPPSTTTQSPSTNTQSTSTTTQSPSTTTQSTSTTTQSTSTTTQSTSTTKTTVTTHPLSTVNRSTETTYSLTDVGHRNHSSVTKSSIASTSRTTHVRLQSTASSPGTINSFTKTTKTSPVNTVGTLVTNRHGGGSCPVGQFKCSSLQCVPVLLVCDGVADCDDKSDETRCPRCQKDRYYCGQTGQCTITNATRCNGVDDCGDSSDESLCTGSCPANYCQQGASCVPGTKTPRCRCTDSFYGNRCQYKTARQQGSEKNASGWKLGLGISMGVLSLVLVVAAVFLVIRKRKLMTSRRPDIGLRNLDYGEYGSDRLS